MTIKINEREVLSYNSYDRTTINKTMDFAIRLHGEPRSVKALMMAKSTDDGSDGIRTRDALKIFSRFHIIITGIMQTILNRSP